MIVTTENFRDTIRRSALEDGSLVRLLVKGKISPESPWRQVIVRPVQVKDARHLQFSYFTDKQDITKNFQGAQASQKLDELLDLPFSAIHFQSTLGEWHAQVSKKGRLILHGGANAIRPASTPSEPLPAPTPTLAHDHEKALPLPANRPDSFLEAVGIMDSTGKIRPAMHAKFAQINQFLQLLEHTGELDQIEHSPLEILDCGCGSAYLSFAAYHYLNEVRAIPAHLTGIDYNGALIDKDAVHAAQLGYADACFARSAIIDFKPETPPDIVLALHACDTATDEAIAQGIRAGSRLIMCAPCCHHDLRNQLDQLPAPAAFDPLLRHGILKQRTAELLTDAFRAQLLRIMGYKTDVVEFVSPDHTDKNLMIRAVRRAGASEELGAALQAEYEALKAFWGVTPYLETLLAARHEPQI